ncbi:MAG: EF-P lysine aminoacylase GenX [Gammaproteobacteria bacterium]|nr:EF-P lysine aminoacylase GenX [Gammaproteobacteria bacterium]
MDKSGDVLWRPTASIKALQARARMYADIRAFFMAKDILEVETPNLSQAATTDPNIQSVTTQSVQTTGSNVLASYLHTSPEFPMKRLLAAGSGSIYQICKVYRHSESGRFHNPEFSLLEWYQLGLNHLQLMDEMELFLHHVISATAINLVFERVTYRQLFQQVTGLNPLTTTATACREYVRNNDTIEELDFLTKDEWLDYIMGLLVIPSLPKDHFTFVYDYPAEQASLARLASDNSAVAERFELFYGALELANGFHELSDANEQRSRFEKDLEKRKQQQQAPYPMDEHFLASLEAGLPPCSGVAVGLDRLFMLERGAAHIDEVLAFPTDRA